MSVRNGKMKFDHAMVTVSYFVEDGKLTVSHVDIECSQLTDIIRVNEATYCRGKPGGLFIGLKKEMRARQPSFLIKAAEGIAPTR